MARTKSTSKFVRDLTPAPSGKRLTLPVPSMPNLYVRVTDKGAKTFTIVVRPKGAKNFATELAEIMTAPVSITENGRSRKVTSRMATLMRLRKKALEGDGRAMDRFLELSIRHAADQEAASSERKLSVAEDDILQRYVDSQIGGTDQSDTPDHEEDSDDSPA